MEGLLQVGVAGVLLDLGPLGLEDGVFPDRVELVLHGGALLEVVGLEVKLVRLGAAGDEVIDVLQVVEVAEGGEPDLVVLVGEFLEQVVLDDLLIGWVRREPF